jgi:hypothetical protein
MRGLRGATATRSMRPCLVSNDVFFEDAWGRRLCDVRRPGAALSPDEVAPVTSTAATTTSAIRPSKCQRKESPAAPAITRGAATATGSGDERTNFAAAAANCWWYPTRRRAVIGAFRSAAQTPSHAAAPIGLSMPQDGGSVRREHRREPGLAGFAALGQLRKRRLRNWTSSQSARGLAWLFPTCRHLAGLLPQTHEHFPA